MLVLSRTLWLAQTNSYVLATERGGPALIVDVPPQPGPVAELLAANDLTAVALLLTHGHVDHMGGAGELAEGTDARVYVHPDDDFLTGSPEDQLRMLFGMVPPGNYHAPAERVHLTPEAILRDGLEQLAGVRLRRRSREALLNEKNHTNLR